MNNQVQQGNVKKSDKQKPVECTFEYRPVLTQDGMFQSGFRLTEVPACLETSRR